MRTSGSFFADTPHTGGFTLYDAVELTSFNANLVLTRNALGDYSLNRTAAGAETYHLVANLNGLTKRLSNVIDGLGGMPFQEQFGTAAGTAGYPATAAGFPPFTGATQLAAPTAAPAKGVRVTSVLAIYQVGVVALTSASLSLNRTVFKNNVAPAVTNIPIAATALTLAAGVGPYVAPLAVTSPVFETTDLSDVSLDFSFGLANTGTIRIYGLGFYFDFNLD